jgi:hypothetical protein
MTGQILVRYSRELETGGVLALQVAAHMSGDAGTRFGCSSDLPSVQ